MQTRMFGKQDFAVRPPITHLPRRLDRVSPHYVKRRLAEGGILSSVPAFLKTLEANKGPIKVSVGGCMRLSLSRSSSAGLAYCPTSASNGLIHPCAPICSRRARQSCACWLIRLAAVLNARHPRNEDQSHCVEQD